MDDFEKTFKEAKEAYENRKLKKARAAFLDLLKIVEGQPKSLKQKKRKIEVLTHLGHVEAALDATVNQLIYLDDAFEIAQELNDIGLMASILNDSGYALIHSGKRDRALERFERAGRLTENFHNQEQYAEALAGKCIILWRTGRYNETIELAQKAISIANSMDNHYLVARMSAVMSSAHYVQENFEKALEFLDISIENYYRAGRINEQATALNNRGEINKRIGKFEDAIKDYDDAIGHLDKTDKRVLGYVYTNQGECYARLGKTMESKSCLSKAENFLAGTNDKYAIACLFYSQALLEIAKNRTEEGLEMLRKAEKRMLPLGMPFDLGLIRYEMALLYSEFNMKEHAQQAAENAIGNFKESGSNDLMEKVETLLLNNKVLVP